MLGSYLLYMRLFILIREADVRWSRYMPHLGQRRPSLDTRWKLNPI